MNNLILKEIILNFGTMDRFRQLETFLAVAELGGFNAAARRLNLSPPSVTRVVSALEERLGTRLFVRTTRHVKLTEAGERLLVDAAKIFEEWATMEASAMGALTEPQGVLSVTAPVVFGQRFIAPIVRDFIDANPKVEARTLLVDRVVNIVEEGLDVAVRIGELPDSSLRATRVGSVRWVVVAAPDYVSDRQAPIQPEDLLNHRTIQVVEASTPAPWHFVREGKRLNITPKPSLRCNTILTSIDASLAGWGITRALSYQVADELGSGRLVELLSAYEDRRIPIHLLYAEGRLASAKVRMFIDFASKALRRLSNDIEGI